MNKKLKQWLIDNMGVAADANDAAFRKAYGQAIADDKLTAEKMAELTADPDASKGNEFVTSLKSLESKFDQLIGALTPKKEVEKVVETKEVEETKETTVETKEAPKVHKAGPSKLAKMISQLGGTPVEIDGKDIDIRVKEAADSYDNTKSTMMYPAKNAKGHPNQMAGQPVKYFERTLDNPTDLAKAQSGVWAKFQILSVTPKLAGNAQRAWEMLNDHEKELLCHLTENGEWDASVDKHARTVKGYQNVNGGRGIKALIDDATSGGLEAAPIVFDDMVIEAPLLYGELFPLVHTVPLDRGRRIEGVSIGRVTGSWGGVDDSAISLFNTASYVSAFDTTIYRWEGAVRIGLDFLSDTPVDFGATITRQYGERLLEDLDDVVATGNGTTQPEGIMNASGTTTVAWGGTTSLGNYESLRFGVAKAEHGASVRSSAVFCGTETSYSRALAIPVGTSDARRLSNTAATPNYDGYVWMQRPYKINESLTNRQIFYAILARYRMYVRRGISIRTSTEGDTLIRANEILIVAQARYGGQIERGAAVAKTTTAPA
jgi:HK97 family phage major capsid protein